MPESWRLLCELLTDETLPLRIVISSVVATLIYVLFGCIAHSIYYRKVS